MNTKPNDPTDATATDTTPGLSYDDLGSVYATYDDLPAVAYESITEEASKK